jgi:hypothetical protein
VAKKLINRKEEGRRKREEELGASQRSKKTVVGASRSLLGILPAFDRIFAAMSIRILGSETLPLTIYKNGMLPQNFPITDYRLPITNYPVPKPQTRDRVILNFL